MGADSRRAMVLLMFVGFAVVIGGALLLRTEGVPVPAIYANDTIDLPPFRMTREVTTGDAVATFEFQWEGEDAWAEALVAGNTPAGPNAQTRELRDGKLIVRSGSHEDVIDAGEGIQVPGVWFTDEDWILARAEQARAVGMIEYTLTDGPTETVLAVTSRLGTTQWTFDKATGIPVDYREIVDGKTVVEHRAVSVTLADGRVVR